MTPHHQTWLLRAFVRFLIQRTAGAPRSEAGCAISPHISCEWRLQAGDCKLIYSEMPPPLLPNDFMAEPRAKPLAEP
jgi:hypothetical protein